MKVLINDIIQKCINSLKEIGISETTISTYYLTNFNLIKDYYNNHDEGYFSSRLNESLHKHYLDQLTSETISKKTFNKRIRCLDIFKKVYQTGSYSWEVTLDHKVQEITNYTISIQSYLKTRNIVLKNEKLESRILYEFSLFLIDNDIIYPKDITSKMVLEFLKLKTIHCPKSMDKVATSIKKYIEYLYNNGIIEKDFSYLVKIKTGRDYKVKKAMAVDTFNSLLESIDVNTVLGKRDYAILVLTATTGLRGKDLINIELKDIDWIHKKISIIQGKTKTFLELPLKLEVCNILADYILNGRPNTTCTKLFIRSVAPFEGFSDSVSLNNMLRRRVSSLGIIREKNDGLTIHSIRRLIGTSIIHNKYPIDTVSQILGHKNTRAARQYISLDITGLRKCALPLSSLGGIL